MRLHELVRSNRRSSNSRHQNRAGFTLVWCAVLMIVMVGMTGLVLDSGLLWGAHRQTHNAADAGALAAAMDMLKNRSNTDATTTATTFV